MLKLRSAMAILVIWSILFCERAARAGRPVVEFSEVGDVCLTAEQQEIALEQLADLGGHAITLVGYSDAHDIRRNPRLEKCLSRDIPPSIEGHERIGVARALYVYELANRAGLPGFDAPPVLLTSFGDSRTSSDSAVVAIVSRRASAEDTYSRRVELETTTIVGPQLAAPAHEVITGPDVNIDVAAIAEEIEHLRGRTSHVLRGVGWTEVGIGMAVMTLGGAFLVTGGVQHQVAADTLDRERAALLEADGYHYVRAGGWAAAVGAGLVVGGIATLVVGRKLRRNAVASRRSVAFGRQGSVVSW